MPAPPRRWFRFSLRTLLVVVTVACIWLGWQLNWVRQRHFALQDKRLEFLETYSDDVRPNAPGFLWIFGENGWGAILLGTNPETLEVTEEGETERLQSLFPEAVIGWAES